MESPQERAVRVLKAILPGYEEFLHEMAADGGWLNYPEKLRRAYLNLRLQWWTFYEDEPKLRSLSARMFLSDEELQFLHIDGKVNEFVDNLISFSAEIDALEAPTHEEWQAWAKDYEKEFQEASEEKRKIMARQSAICLIVLVAGFLNHLALMLHGRTLCRLVADAKKGDDDAFCKAVQVDRTILNLPYFRERLIHAQLGKEPDFLNKLAYRLKTPILSGKIRHPKLWLTFAYLEDEGLFTLRHEQILDICRAVGAYNADDVGHLRKRLSEYRRQQGTTSIIF